MVAERQHLFADDLAGFMALAGDHHHVAMAEIRNRRLDRLAPVADLDRTAMPGVASDLARLRNHVDSYEYEEASVLATRLLGQIGSEVP